MCVILMSLTWLFNQLSYVCKWSMISFEWNEQNQFGTKTHWQKNKAGPRPFIPGKHGFLLSWAAAIKVALLEEKSSKSSHLQFAWQMDSKSARFMSQWSHLSQQRLSLAWLTLLHRAACQRFSGHVLHLAIHTPLLVHLVILVALVNM